MNDLYRMELMSMLTDLDAFIEDLFIHTGFYESEKFTKKGFKSELLKDYREVFLSEGQ
jgi:hypothetical protein